MAVHLASMFSSKVMCGMVMFGLLFVSSTFMAVSSTYSVCTQIKIDKSWSKKKTRVAFLNLVLAFATMVYFILQFGGVIAKAVVKTAKVDNTTWLCSVGGASALSAVSLASSYMMM